MHITQKDRELLACVSYKEFLANELEYRKEKNKNYSLRAMARDFEIPASSLSTILKSTKNLSEDSILRITQNLQKAAPICEYFRNLALAEILDPSNFNNPNYLKAKDLRLQYLYMPSEANHRAVNSMSLSTFALSLLLRIEGELKTNEALCQRLNVSMDTLRKMIEELQALGWVQESANGPISHIRYMELGNRGNSYEIRNTHKKMLSQGLWNLDHLALEKRYFYSSFFTMNPDRFSTVCEKMRKFALTTGEAEEPSFPGHEVYAMGTFIFPLTHRPD